MTRREHEQDDLVNLAEIREIELRFLKSVRSLSPGEHRSHSQGTGFDFVGLRDWQAGDRFSAIDWAQSSLTNFSPLMVREFDQAAAASVVVVTDRSRSTRCGVDDVSIATAHARAIAMLGISAVFFQDSFGLITFDAGVTRLSAIQPRIGKSHVVRCLAAYQHGQGMQRVLDDDRLSTTVAGFLRRTSLVAFISDFLFENPGAVLEELAQLGTTHDVFVVLVDSAFAFALPHLSGGWIEVFDVETGRSRLMSRSALNALALKVHRWQEDVVRIASKLDLDVLRIGIDEAQSDVAIAEFVVARRMRKVS